MYEKQDAQELEAFGFKLSDFGDVEVWPDNMPAINLFNSIATQWRHGGMGGITGLDYNVLFHRMDRMNLSDRDYEWLFDDIRVIESEALTILNPKD